MISQSRERKVTGLFFVRNALCMWYYKYRFNHDEKAYQNKLRKELDKMNIKIFGTRSVLIQRRHKGISKNAI